MVAKPRGTRTTRALTNQEIRSLGTTDNAMRWYPKHERIKPYFNSIRAPSRAYPSSYWKAASTKKFANWIIDNAPLLAVRLGLIPDRPYWLVRTDKIKEGSTYIEAGETYVAYDISPRGYGRIQTKIKVDTYIALDGVCPHIDAMWEIVNE